MDSSPGAGYSLCSSSCLHTEQIFLIFVSLCVSLSVWCCCGKNEKTPKTEIIVFCKTDSFLTTPSFDDALAL